MPRARPHHPARLADELTLGWLAVDNVCDYEAEDGLNAGCPPTAFPERGGYVNAGGEVVPVNAPFD